MPEGTYFVRLFVNNKLLPLYHYIAKSNAVINVCYNPFKFHSFITMQTFTLRLIQHQRLQYCLLRHHGEFLVLLLRSLEVLM